MYKRAPLCQPSSNPPSLMADYGGGGADFLALYSSCSDNDPFLLAVVGRYCLWGSENPFDLVVEASAKFSTSPFSSHTNVGVVDQLKSTLTDEQLRLSRNTYFGYFLEMPRLTVHNQMIKFLICRELNQDNPDLFYVKINKNTLCFGLREFSIVTGLRCIGDVKHEDCYRGFNRLKEAFFPGRNRVSMDDLISCFEQKEWQSDGDAVRISLLYFIYTFLFSTMNCRSYISNGDFHLIESGKFELFPWGKVVFTILIDSVKDKLRKVNKFYRFGGLPLALQI
ncbi:hypothetical protein RND71_025382 [Anisodus tanguticus]|uniref:DUF1985 domain-containing protein n=1 Tax=Anisodus tanguticus TaxID=243964 RepID=A0AAE1VAB9_9SOLA|nr:hypothetical protein RND71_025382 [Anisodus tanguticus]